MGDCWMLECVGVFQKLMGIHTFRHPRTSYRNSAPAHETFEGPNSIEFEFFSRIFCRGR